VAVTIEGLLFDPYPATDRQIALRISGEVGQQTVVGVRGYPAAEVLARLQSGWHWLASHSPNSLTQSTAPHRLFGCRSVDTDDGSLKKKSGSENGRR